MDLPFPVAFLALVGPPAAGKYTVAAGLCQLFGGVPFRLREFAMICHHNGWLPPHDLGATHSPDGYPDAVVEEVLHAAFLHRRFTSGRLVVLPDLPASLEHLTALRRITVALAASLTVLEFDADEQVLVTRALNRRSCNSCAPAEVSGMGQRVQAAPDNQHRCRACNTILSQLPEDGPEVFNRLLQQFRVRIPEIRSSAQALGVPMCAIRAGEDQYTVLRDAAAVAVQLLDIRSVAQIRPWCRPSSVSPRGQADEHDPCRLATHPLPTHLEDSCPS